MLDVMHKLNVGLVSLTIVWMIGVIGGILLAMVWLDAERGSCKSYDVEVTGQTVEICTRITR